MQVKNIDLQAFSDFLHDAKLIGKASVGRSKLKEVFIKADGEYIDEQRATIDEYEAWTDKEEGEFSKENPELNKALNELALEKKEIEIKMPFKKDFTEALEYYDKELSGQDAEVYAKLYENLVEENE